MFLNLARTIVILLTLTSLALAQICAIPGNDGSASLSGIVNSYWRPSATASYGPTSTSISLSDKTGASSTLNSGDLVLIIQMQCADINFSNTNAYGDGISETGDGNASGYSNPSNCLAGQHEYVRAGPGSNDSNLDLSLSPLQFTYVQATGTNTQGRRSFQIIRVPQYIDATLTATVNAPPWNGNTGGIVALDIARNLNLNSQSINVDGLGFRGGGGRDRSVTDGVNRYRWDNDTRHASKGEGIAGTPRYVSNKTEPNTGNPASITDNGSSWRGYPTGSSSTGDFARGAPGNAGGGGIFWNGSSDNGGGAGGGNGGTGGRGGAGWRSFGYTGVAADYSNLPEKKWGFGGSTIPASVGQIVLGGGGGAGDNNNNSTATLSSGANGGGIVLIRAHNITGTGSISARGARAADNPLNDGAGGGGAGGSIVVISRNSSATLDLDVRGGRGGDAWPTGGSAHGTGGGGGGGVIISSSSYSTQLSGGVAGDTTTSDSPAGGAKHGAESGATGIETLISLATDSPGVNTAYNCLADIAVNKTIDTSTAAITAGLITDADGSGNVTPGDTVTFNIEVTNLGLSNASSIVINDSVPAAYSYAASSMTGGDFQNESDPAGTGLSWTISNLAASSSSTLTFRALVNEALPSSYENTVNASTSSLESTNDNNSSSVTPDVLRIVKYVCNESTESDNSCDTSDFSFTSSASPGDILIYKITYENFATPITQFVFEDTVPIFTSLIEDGFGSPNEARIECHNATGNIDIDLGSLPITMVTADIIASCSGTILPSQTGAVLFKARVN